MERDIRRDRGQWKGTHSFTDIICDGDNQGLSKRNGGLKMGQPYYFYYELDGSIEAHDPSLPSTSVCPYLPGQTVNTLWIPAEKSDRKRSGSLSSVHSSDMMTLKPEDKFITPRPAPPVPDTPGFRLATSHAQNSKHKRSARSISPTPNWSWSPRKLFTRKNSSSSQGSDKLSDEDCVCNTWSDEQGNLTAPGETWSRDMSPESLHRFLSDATPVASEPVESCERLALGIPDDIVEETEDDENFATSALSESTPPTILSPPPSRRHQSSTILLHHPANESVLTLKALVTEHPTSQSPTRPPPAVPTQTRFDDYVKEETPTSRFSFSSDESYFIDEDSTPQSPDTDNDIPSFYHSEAEDDDEDFVSSSGASERRSFQPLQDLSFGRDSLEQSLAKAFAGYSLPRNSMDGAKMAERTTSREPVYQGLASPALIARTSIEVLPSTSASLLGAHTRSVSNDFVNELSWIADVIHHENRI